MNQVLFRTVSKAVVVLLVNATIPLGFAGVLKEPIAAIFHKPRLVIQRAEPRSKVLSAKQMQTTRGRAGQCPYIAGQNKWDVVYDGVDMLTGNYSTSVTDLDFEGGYGIPVNVTRSYSANSADEGPLGWGWSLSADVRSTAGGLLKSGAAPVRAVPKKFMDRPPLEIDPNAVQAAGSVGQPAQAVVATDASGRQETIQKDVDGVLTTPPWDNNVSNAQYQFITFNGQVYQVLISEQTTTPDGTTYTYQTEGNYVNGSVPYNDPSATPTPSNVLKVTQAVDRQGNVTRYVYGSSYVNFQKSDGETQEYPLIQVQMPNGHQITFTWTGNRITSASDGSRIVTYGYGNGYLTSVTTPAGKITSYTYGGVSQNGFSDAGEQTLSSITDPRGLKTCIYYQENYVAAGPADEAVEAPSVTEIVSPSGSVTTFQVQLDVNGVYPIGMECGGYLNDPTQQVSFTNPIWNLYVSYVSGAPSGATQISSELDFNIDPSHPSGNYIQTDTIGTYDLATEDQTENVQSSWGTIPLQEMDYFHSLLSNNFMGTETDTVSQYNFNGQPLSQTTTELHEDSNRNFDPTSTKETDYAYWNQTKYWQQEAVRQTTDTGFRFSYTDYYPNTAPAGSRGQTYQVFDNAHGNFVGTGGSGDAWKYTIAPTGPYSAQFDYDAEGRCTDVWKLQSTATNPWKYVRTHTDYGSNSDGSWGEASDVIEDDGGINRETQTLGYTPDGKADEVEDAAGHVFKTNYDLDGVIQSVYRIDNGLNQPLVAYTYGSGSTNGVPISITDGLTNVTQTIEYYSSGFGLGQVQSVTENDPGGTYSTSYTYNAEGFRRTATYATPNGSTSWGYSDYMMLGVAPKLTPAFRRIVKLDSNGNPTPEEFDYQYDGFGRLQGSAFAQTPFSNDVPPSGGFYYGTHNSPSDVAAQSRCRAEYTYDGGGRLTDITYLQDVWNGSGYTTSAIYDNSCAYDSALGLKTSSTNTWAGGNTWTESYQYDPNFDYLTSASYGDGLPNATPTWSYDAAGNRNDSICDNLNRPTSIGGVNCTSDILGNRLTTGSTSMTWDCLNRMTSLTNSSTAESYNYRADGMRVSKTNGTNSTIYRYDGQMGIEDVDTGTNPAVTDYALGARGIDAISKTANGTTTVVYPIYDAHGNMVGDVSKYGTSFQVNDKRSFDAWGVVRQGAQTGDPKGRYCANLGHKQDDESGLIYMRARYYEPSSGRFISQDPNRKGTLLFAYCSDDPANRADSTGEDDAATWILWAVGVDCGLMAAGFAMLDDLPSALTASSIAVWCMAAAFGEDAVFGDPKMGRGQAGMQVFGAILINGIGGSRLPAWMNGLLGSADAGLEAGDKTSACVAVTACFIYTLACAAILLDIDSGT